MSFYSHSANQTPGQPTSMTWLLCTTTSSTVYLIAWFHFDQCFVGDDQPTHGLISNHVCTLQCLSEAADPGRTPLQSVQWNNGTDACHTWLEVGVEIFFGKKVAINMRKIVQKRVALFHSRSSTKWASVVASAHFLPSTALKARVAHHHSKAIYYLVQLAGLWSVFCTSIITDY